MGILARTLVTRRRRSRCKLLICSVTFFAVASPLRAQELDKLKEAYSRNHIFELRNAVHRSSVPEFYKAAVEASANQVELAVNHLRSIIAASPHSSDADDAHDLLTNLFFRNGLYRDGMKEIESTLKERPEAADAKNMLPLATALGAMQRLPPLLCRTREQMTDALRSHCNLWVNRSPTGRRRVTTSSGAFVLADRLD